VKSPDRVAPTGPWRNRIVGSGEEAPDQLVANPANWRRHPHEQQRALAGALGEVGWVAQVMINATTGHIVDGHLRVELALARHEPMVPVTYVELSEEEERLVLASFDPLAAMASAEQEALAALLAELSVEDSGLAALLAALAGDLAKAGLTDPDEAPEIPAEPYVKPGQLYRLGDHRLLCGDATLAREVARLMDGEVAQAMWTDPPYGVSYVGKNSRALRIANDDAGGPGVFAGACRIAPLAPSAPFYVTVPAGPRQLDFLLAVRDAGWRLHQELVWVKNSIVLGHSDYHYAHEPILYGYTPGPGRPGRGAHEGSHWYGDNSASSVLAYDKPLRNAEHPTMKPVGLISECLTNSTRPSDLVYEPFAGSGSTLIAAQTLGRRCYAIEIDPAYAQVTIERWQSFSGQSAERIDG
jgi:DNA modification methylase